MLNIRTKAVAITALLLACATLSDGRSRRPVELVGFHDVPTELAREQQFLAIPDTKLAEHHMQVLAGAPHIAGSPEDYKTALYVAERFREAGMETTIVPYRVWLNYPGEVSVDVTAPKSVHMHGPSPESVPGDPFEQDSRVTPAFSGYSPSGDAEADVVYANYGRPEDFEKLKELGVDVRGKIVVVRYGENFRGVKAYLAQEYGAAAVIMYSDPIDDGYSRGEAYPNGPWRPATSVQRGTVEFGFEHPGDPTTPGFASTPDLPDSKRVSPLDNPDMPKVPTTPLSYHDAQPILANLAGPESPREWQGALPFTYHVGPGPVRVKLHLKQDYGYRTIWNVIGKVRGTQYPDELVIAGNHRDAWVYGAVDPVSGTTAMLEAVHGLGELLKTGWRPKRTIVFASWDAEEQGLIGSTEWVEQHEQELGKAVAYFNTDTGAAGPNFRASSTPSLKQFIREITKAVPSPKGGSLYEQWITTGREPAPTAAGGSDAALGNLGSGSDYTSFVDHLGIPSSDIRCTGNYGVYHSVFDNYDWYRKFGDPGFLYSQELARVFGLEVMRMADSDVLPLDYETYGTEILDYVKAAERHARERLGATAPNFTDASNAALRLAAAGRLIGFWQKDPTGTDVRALNAVLNDTERELLLPNGLPRRPWFKHSIFAPADLKGYSADVIPGVNEAIQNQDAALALSQLAELTAALNRAADKLERFVVHETHRTTLMAESNPAH